MALYRRLVGRKFGHVGFLSDEHVRSLGGFRDGLDWSAVPVVQGCGGPLATFLGRLLQIPVAAPENLFDNVRCARDPGACRQDRFYVCAINEPHTDVEQTDRATLSTQPDVPREFVKSCEIRRQTDRLVPQPAADFRVVDIGDARPSPVLK